LNTSAGNCGACGRVCPAPVNGSATCSGGACGQACPGAQSNCSGTCQDLTGSCSLTAPGMCSTTGSWTCSGTSRVCVGPAPYAHTSCYPDGDGDHYCTSSTANVVCGACPPGQTTSCNSYSDCDDGPTGFGRYQNLPCGYDIDNDGYCGGTSTYCVGDSCAGTSHGIFNIWLLPPTCSHDCDDVNWYIPRDGNTTCATIEYYDSSHGTSPVGHCCCIGCPQPNPYPTTFTINCPAGYAFYRCHTHWSSGGGNYSVSQSGDGTSTGTCTLTESCIGCEGVSVGVGGYCQPSP
jgi:hypothetical protein